MENEAVKTYFNGAITQNQLMSIIIAIIAVVLILAFTKKVIKLVLTVVVIIGALIYFGVMSPTQLKDITDVVSEKGQGVFTQIAEVSQNVKVDTSGDDLDVKIKIEDNWVSMKDVSSFIKSDDGVYSVIVNGKSYSVSDDSIKQVLDLMKK